MLTARKRNLSKSERFSGFGQDSIERRVLTSDVVEGACEDGQFTQWTIFVDGLGDAGSVAHVQELDVEGKGLRVHVGQVDDLEAVL
jgi:hypothetical protein